MSETPLDLDAIRARADAATAGPWKEFRDANGFLVVQTRPGDSLFAAHAREDIPALLGLVEYLTADGEGVRRERNDYFAEVERLNVLLQSERDALGSLQHEFEVHFGWTVPEGKVCHACHELEAEENHRLLIEAWEEIDELRNGHQTPKTAPVAANRPAQVAADPTQADGAAMASGWVGDPRPSGSALRPPLRDEWGRRHEDNPPQTQEAQS